MSAIGGISGSGGGMMPQVVSGASMRMPSATKMANLFQKMDTSNSGSITKAQFEKAFQTLNPPPSIKTMGSDSVFNRLDPNGTGSVSKQDFINGMKTLVTGSLHSSSGAVNTKGSNAVARTDFTHLLTKSINSLNSLGGNKPAPSPIKSNTTPTENIGNNINTLA